MKYLTTLLAGAFLAFAGIAPTAYAQTTLDAGSNDMKMTGVANGAIGNSISVNGDVNGDGYNDLLVNYYEDSTTTDSAVLFYGSADGLSATPTVTDADAIFHGVTGDGEGKGATVSFAGDVNGDGYDDFLVSNKTADSNAGKIFLVYGSDVAYSGEYSLETMEDDDVDIFTGVLAFNYAGVASNGVGDVNGDGYDDFIIGAHFVNSMTGEAYLMYGTPDKHTGSTNLISADVTFTGENSGDAAGNRFASGDLNGDGYSDVMISAPGYESNTGRVYVVYGGADALTDMSLADADAIFTGAEECDGLGGARSGTGDVNGDGYDDLMLGMAEAGGDCNDIPGGVYIQMGQAEQLSSATVTDIGIKITVEGSNGSYAFRAADAQDVNGDGYADVIFTGGDTTTLEYSIYILLGSADVPAGTVDVSVGAYVIIEGDVANEGIGTSLSLADANGDVLPDVFFGAPDDSSGATGGGSVYQMTLFTDVDGDGVAGDGGLVAGTDCNDADETVTTDQTYYADADGDGFGDPNTPVTACSSTAPDGAVGNSTDTDDTSLGAITTVTESDGVVSVVYESGYTQEVTPFAEGTSTLVAMSTDGLRWVATNGKLVRSFFEGTQIDQQRIYKTKATGKKKLKVVSLRSGYENVIFVSSKGLQGRVAVMRFTDSNTLTKLNKHAVTMKKKNPTGIRVAANSSTHRFTTRWIKNSKQTRAVWKLLKSGDFSQVE